MAEPTAPMDHERRLLLRLAGVAALGVPVGPDFATPYTEAFDQTYMRSLFDYGFAKARDGYRWAKRPPG